MDFRLSTPPATYVIAQFAHYLFHPQDHEIPEEKEYSFPVETKGAKVFSSQFPWCFSDLVKGNERVRGQGSQNKAQFVYNSVNTKNSGEILCMFWKLMSNTLCSSCPIFSYRPYYYFDAILVLSRYFQSQEVRSALILRQSRPILQMLSSPGKGSAKDWGVTSTVTGTPQWRLRRKRNIFILYFSTNSLF